MRQVLIKLRQHGLYVKLEKCEFSVRTVSFLGVIISLKGIAIEPRRVNAILEWPEPKSFRDIQGFIRFTNFYQRFICAFSALAARLMAMLKGSKAGKFLGPCGGSTGVPYIAQSLHKGTGFGALQLGSCNCV